MLESADHLDVVGATEKADAILCMGRAPSLDISGLQRIEAMFPETANDLHLYIRNRARDPRRRCTFPETKMNEFYTRMSLAVLLHS